jgi:hypothetical protein
MKYYIILQPSIKSMGGEEMYTRNIVCISSRPRISSVVFHSICGSKIYIDELEKFRIITSRNLNFHQRHILKGELIKS